MVEINVTEEFHEWYEDLSEQDSDAVEFAVDLLEQKGVALEFPYSSKINGASFALRELRVQSGGRPLRVFYAFDPRRQAILLLGGDKTGDDRFYERFVPICEELWKEYLSEIP